MKILNNINNKFLYTSFIFIWVCLIVGVNVNTDHFFLDKNYKLSDILYFFRLHSQFILFVVLIVFNLFLIKKIKFNYLFIVFILLNIIQIISLFYSENSNLNIIYNIQTMNILLFLNLFSHFFPERFFDLLFVLFFFLFVIFLYFYFENFYLFFKRNYLFYGFYNANPFIEIIENPPRSSGMARLALLFFLFFLFFLDFKNYKRAKILIILPITVAIFLYQSRTILFIYFFIIFILSFATKFKINNLALDNCKFNFFNFILIPFIFFLLISNLQPKNFYFLIKKTGLFDTFYEKNELDPKYKEYRIIRKNSPHSFSSGRSSDWKKLIKNNQKYYFGNGTMGDRFLIRQTASSGILYLYASSGIFGVSLFFFLIYKVLNMIYKNKNYIQSINNYNKKIIFSIYIILMFLLRSILENSFLVFGIDNVVFLVAMYYLILKFNFKKIN